MKKSIVSSAAIVTLLIMGALFALPVVSQAQTVACPAGYTCTPITSVPNCPTGFVCTPITSPSPTVPAPTPTSCYIFSSNLGVGSRGVDVVALQTWLIDSGFNIPLISTGVAQKGYFGPSTAAALSAYQASVGLPQTGALNAQTRAQLNGSCFGTPTTNPGQPVIISLSTTSGPAGSTVTITGSGFAGLNLVVWTGPGADTSLTPTSVSTNNITFNVPSNSAPGSYQVSVLEKYATGQSSNGIGSNAVAFTVTSSSTTIPCPLGQTWNGSMCVTTTSQASITVTYPQAGNVLDDSGIKNSGLIANIQWTSSGLGNDPVAIVLASNSKTFKFIATNVPNTGTYAWAYDPTLPNGTYQIEVEDQVKAGITYGISGNFQIVNSPAGGGQTSQSSATITSGSQTSSLTPTISGTANGVSQVGVVLANTGSKVYGSGLIPVVNGNWSVTVSPALVAGQYTTYVYDGNNNQLASGALSVTSSSGNNPNAPVQLSSCSTISQPGVYQLTQNINTSGTCFTITSNNVALDGEGHSVTGGGRNGYGITISGSGISNFTIANVSLSGFINGIEITNVSGGYISGVNSSNNVENGISLTQGSNIPITNNTLNSNGYNGIDLDFGSNNDLISGNTLNHNSEAGIELGIAQDQIQSNTANSNAIGIDISISGGLNTSVTGNTFTGNSAYDMKCQNADPRIPLSSYANNTYTSTNCASTITQPSLPDLVVTNITADQNYIYVTYQNNGAAASGNFVVNVSTPTGSFTTNSLYPYQVPAPGASVTTPGITLANIGLTPGSTANITATVDSQNSIQESNESNNTFSKTVMVPGGTQTQPSITSITPVQATANTVVTINGTDLGGTTEVDFSNSGGVSQGSILNNYTDPSGLQHNNITISSNGTSLQFTLSGAFAYNVDGALQVRVVTPAGSSNGLPITISAPAGTTVSQPLTASCAAGNAYASGSLFNVTWGATASGGSGSYKYQWTLVSPISEYIHGGVTSSSFVVAYGSPGVEQASVVVSDGNTTASANCSTPVGIGSLQSSASLTASIWQAVRQYLYPN